MILFLLSLFAGVLTILAPCTISLLPVIVGGSLSGERSIKRAITVTAALGVSVVLFTLLLKVSTAFVSVTPAFWQDLSGTVIILLGVVMIFPALYERLTFINSLNRGSNKILAAGYKKQNRAGDIIIGAALGPVFSSCSPTYFLILAAVLPVSFTAGVLYMLAYAIGLCGGLLVVTIAGQKLLEKFGVAADPAGWFKRSVGFLFVLVGISIFLGYDKKLELVIAKNVFDITRIEQSLLQSRVTSGGKPGVAGEQGVTTPSGDDNSAGVYASSSAVRLAKKKAKYNPAPEITNPSGFINTGGAPLNFRQFRGNKVVLVDFWTYSCINCQRTLPYVKAWYDKYSAMGLEIVGIHTPEFSFEKVQSNVEKATRDFGIKYPVVLDNDYGTWNAFGNQFWPRKYLIDIDGYVVYDHIGEGNYDETEQAIREALKERAAVLGTSESVSGSAAPQNIISFDPAKVGSPETYFGYARNEYLANGTAGAPGTQTLTIPKDISPNRLLLGGTWDFTPEYAEAKSYQAEIFYRFNSKNVYFVASSASGVKIKVFLDGKPVGSNAGADVAGDGTVTIKENRLYHLVRLPEYGEHTLEIKIEQTGLDAYTFTFG